MHAKSQVADSNTQCLYYYFIDHDVSTCSTDASKSARDFGQVPFYAMSFPSYASKYSGKALGVCM